jgi:hypothetical protein
MASVVPTGPRMGVDKNVSPPKRTCNVEVLVSPFIKGLALKLKERRSVLGSPLFPHAYVRLVICELCVESMERQISITVMSYA